MCAKTSPPLNVEEFQQLLAAAYVLQQHNESLSGKNPRLDPALILSEIAKIESQMREGSLDIRSAADLMANRLRNLTDADGVSICLLRNGYLEWVAQAGGAVRIPGGSVACNSLAATDRLRTGKPFESPDAYRDVRLELSLCRKLELGSLLAVPIQRAGEVAGLVELRWKTANALRESDQRTCELMAGLMAQLLGQDHEAEGLPASEAPPVADAVSVRQQAGEPGNELREQTAVEKASEDRGTECQVCGHVLGEHEEFCGNCSMVRPMNSVSASREGLQSKWARMWFMQKAQGALQGRRVQGVVAPTSTAASTVDPPQPIAHLRHGHLDANAQNSASTVTKRKPSAASPGSAECASANSPGTGIASGDLQRVLRRITSVFQSPFSRSEV